MANKQTILPKITIQPVLNTSNKSIQRELPSVLPSSVLPSSVVTSKRTSNSPSLLFNYNDPNQINSLADVLYSKDKSKAWTELWKNSIAPLTNKDKYGRWDPQFLVAGLNLLTNVGETMDVVANPFKGLLMEGTTGFKKAVNWDGQGRYNYDWNTGNVLINLALEVITDPLNIASFGLSGLGKTVITGGISAAKELLIESSEAALKGVVKEVTEEATEEIAEGFTKGFIKETIESAVTDTIKQTRKQFMNYSVEKTAKKIAKQAGEPIDKFLNIPKAFKENLTQRLTRDFGLDANAAEVLLKNLDEAINMVGKQTSSDLLNKASLTIVKSLKTARNIVQASDRFIVKAGLSEAGIYPAWLLAKKVNPDMGKIAERIANSAITKIVNSKAYTQTMDALEYVKALADDISSYTNANDLLKAVGSGDITYKELGDILCAKMTKHIHGLKEAVQKHTGDKQFIEIINEVIKKETGFETIEAYLKDMQTLKGHISVDSELKLMQFEIFVKRLRELDTVAARKEQLTYLTEKINKLKDIKSKTLPGEFGVKHKAAQTLLEESNVTTTALRKVEAGLGEAHRLPKKFTSQNFETFTKDLKNVINQAAFLIDNAVDEVELNQIKTILKEYFDTIQNHNFKVDLTVFNNMKGKLELDGISSDSFKIIRPNSEKTVGEVSEIYDLYTQALEIIKKLEDFEKTNKVVNKYYTRTKKSLDNIFLDLRAKFTKFCNKTTDIALLEKMYIDYKHMLNKMYNHVMKLDTIEKLWETVDTAVEVRLKKLWTSYIKNTKKRIIDSKDEIARRLAGAAKTLNVTKSFDDLADLSPDSIKRSAIAYFENIASQKEFLTSVSLKEHMSIMFLTLKANIFEKTQNIPELDNLFNKLIKDYTDKLGVIYESCIAEGNIIDIQNVIKALQEFEIDPKVIPTEYTKVLDELIDSTDTEIKTLAPLTKTLEDAAADAEKYLNESIVSAPKLLNIIQEINKASGDVKSFYEDNLSDIRTSPYFSERTNRILKLLNKKGIEDNLIKPEFKPTVDSIDSYTDTVNKTKIEKAYKTLDDLAHSNKPVNIKDVKDAYKTLRELHENLSITKNISRRTVESDVSIFSKEVFQPDTLDDLPGLHYAATEDTAYDVLAYDVLDDLLDYINFIEPAIHSAKMMRITADTVYYRLKTEQVANIMVYVSDKELIKAFNEICDQTGDLGAEFNTYTYAKNSTYSAEAEKIINLMHHFRNYVNTHNKIMQLHSDNICELNQVIALRSAVENFARKSISEMSEDDAIEQIIKRAESYYNNAYKFTESLSQDKIVERELELFKEYGIKDYYHKADSDAQVTWIIFKEKLKELAEEKFKGKKIVAADIETRNLAKNTDILELGYYDGERRVLHTVKYKNRTEASKYIPDDSVLAKCYGKETLPDGTTRIRTRAEQIEKYYEDHIADASKGEVPTNLKEYYENFINEIVKDGDGSDVVLLMHNGVDFDKPRIVYNMQNAGVSPEDIARFENIELCDTLVELRRQAGYMSFNDMQVHQIKQIFEDHLKSLEYTNTGVFFDAGIKNIRTEINNVIKDYGNKLKLDGTELEELGAKASKAVKETIGKGTSSDDIFVGHLVNIRELLNNAHNKTVAFTDKLNKLPIIAKASFENLKDFQDELSEETQKFLTSLGLDPNLSRVLYSQTIMFNAYGYTKYVDVATVKNWFNIATENGYADIRLMRLYNSLSTNFEKFTEKIRHLDKVDDAAFNESVINFIKEVKDKLPNARWASAIRTDLENPLANFTIATQLHRMLKKSTNVTTDVTTDVTEAFAELSKKYEDLFDVIQSVQPNVPIYKTVDNAVGYSNILNSLKNAEEVHDAMFEYELKLGANKIYSNRQQYINSALKNTTEYVQKMQNLVRRLDKVQLKVYKIQATRNLDSLCIYQTVNILNKTPEDLLKYMVYHKAPIMFFAKDNQILIDGASQLLQNQALYKELGIEFYEEADSFYIYFGKGHSVDYFTDDLGYHATFNGKQIDIDYSTEKGLSFYNFDNAEDIAKIYDQMARLTNGQSIGQLGKQLNKETIENYYANLPKALQEKLDIKELTKSTMFTGYTFDSMNLGSLASRQKFDEFMPSDLTKLIANNNIQIIQKANDKNLMLDFWFNKDMSIAELAQLWGADKLRIYLLNNPNYTVMMLVEDAKYVGKGFQDKGYRVIKLDVSKDSLWEQAIKDTNGAIMVPSTMYADIYDALNSSLLYDNPVYKVAHQLTYMFKLGLTSSVGKVFRDVIDTQLRTAIDTKDALGIAKNNFKAMGQLKQYKKAVCEILELSEIDYDKLTAVGIKPDEFATAYIKNKIEAENLLHGYYDSLKDIMKADSNRMFLNSNKELYFKAINKSGFDEATFDTLHILLTESGSFGNLPAWSKYTKDLHMSKQAQFAKDYAEGLIGSKMIENKNIWEATYDSVSALGNMLLTPAQYVDKVNRIAQYLTLMDSGFVNPMSAIGRVARTNFDNALKTDTDRILELAIPFYSFFKHNALHWAKIVSEQPYAARLFADYLEEINSEDRIGTVSEFEALNNISLQNAQLAGNIILGNREVASERVETRISKNGKPYQVKVTDYKPQVTLKLNLPFMEAYQLATQPISYFMDSANPVIQVVLQSWLGNNPSVPTGLTETLGIYRPYNFDEGGRAKLQLSTLVPFVGPKLQAYGPDGYAKKQYEETGFLGNLILPSVFGRVKRYSDTEFVNKTYKPKKKTYVKKTNNPNYYNKKTYNSRYYSNNYYKSRPLRTRYAKMTRYYPERLKRRPRTSPYKLLYNSYGKSRIQYIGLPRTVRNAPYAIRSYFNYTR